MACLVAPTLLHETSEVLIPVERNAQKGDLQKNAKYLRVITTVPLYLMFFLAFYLTLFLTFFLAFYLTFFLAFYLTSTMTNFVAFYCVFFLTFFLAFYLASILTFCLAFCLASILTFCLAFFLAFGSRRAPQNLELAIWCSGPGMPHSIWSW